MHESDAINIQIKSKELRNLCEETAFLRFPFFAEYYIEYYRMSSKNLKCFLFPDQGKNAVEAFHDWFQ